MHWATLLVFVVIAALGWAGVINERGPVALRRLVPRAEHPVHPRLGDLQGPDLELRQLGDQRRDGAVPSPCPCSSELHRLEAAGPRRRPPSAAWSCCCGSRGPARPSRSGPRNFGVARAVPGFMLGMLAFQMKDRLARLPFARFVMWALLAAFFVASGLGASRTSLLLLIYAVGLAGSRGRRGGCPGRRRRALAPWAQLSFSLYLLHPIALKIALNWSGLRDVAAGRRRHAAVVPAVDDPAVPDRLSVADGVRAPGAGLAGQAGQAEDAATRRGSGRRAVVHGQLSEDLRNAAAISALTRPITIEL
ncbi:hypothetical protein ACRAWD_07025 [Caulobacter segnis]